MSDDWSTFKRIGDDISVCSGFDGEVDVPPECSQHMRLDEMSLTRRRGGVGTVRTGRDQISKDGRNEDERNRAERSKESKWSEDNER